MPRNEDLATERFGEETVEDSEQKVDPGREEGGEDAFPNGKCEIVLLRRHAGTGITNAR
tara:strand:- start:712 stop:888 length:177 start_codon:yes stop_codon:yes gene_type:complete